MLKSWQNCQFRYKNNDFESLKSQQNRNFKDCEASFLFKFLAQQQKSFNQVTIQNLK